jgi:hypothetical protein
MAAISSAPVVSSVLAITKPSINSVASAPVGTKQRARVGVEDGLHQSFGLAEGDRLAVGRIEKAADLQLMAGGARLLLAEADARHLRRAIGAARDSGLVERVDAVNARNLLDADDAFMAGLVREPRRTDHVADGAKSGRSGAAPLIDDDVTFLHADPLLLEP